MVRATALAEYTDWIASQLSGGNQWKLSLAIAMIGSFPGPTSMRNILKNTSIDRKSYELADRAVEQSVNIARVGDENVAVILTKPLMVDAFDWGRTVARISRTC